MRTHLCGEITEQLAGQPVVLCGWVGRRRDLGGLIFIGLRDYAGTVQIVIEPDSPAFGDAESLRNEFCVRISGEVRMRPESQWNESMATGRIELVADKVELLNASAPMPLLMTDEDGEEIRLKYRYLDLRRPRMQNNLRTRARMYRAIRNSLDDKGFTELETPILTKATPEGARDYLVPSRVHAGKYFALPQSPQLFKQLLMMSGMDRYYQIARCFRDEDLRSDRQPEFTQLDIEMAFVEERDVQDCAETMIREVFRETLNVELPESFPQAQLAQCPGPLRFRQARICASRWNWFPWMSTLRTSSSGFSPVRPMTTTPGWPYFGSRAVQNSRASKSMNTRNTWAVTAPGAWHGLRSMTVRRAWKDCNHRSPSSWMRKHGRVFPPQAAPKPGISCFSAPATGSPSVISWASYW